MILMTTETKTKVKFAPELLDPKYNKLRKPSLPYGIIINDRYAGILIPTEQLETAEWRRMPTEEQLTTVELTEPVTGLLLRRCRIIVLACVTEYVRWKDIEENGEQAGEVIGLYDNYRNSLDKKSQEVCSEHALIFLSRKNQLLHKVPIVVRFKNVALWSFKSAREDFYRKLEKTFAEYNNIEYSGKDDKWRSLGVLEVEFKGVKEGQNRNKSYCCKTNNITEPTLENLASLFLGQTKQLKKIWKLHNSIAGFVESEENQLPALAASKGEVVPTREARRVEVEVLEDEFDQFDEEELLEE